MKNDILLNIDNPCQLEKLYRQTNQLLSGHLKLCILDSNITYPDTYVSRKAFKSHLDTLEQLILNNRKDN
ncbi:MAG: hypothetical protein WKG06_08430 [Segetibacter sp.]